MESENLYIVYVKINEHRYITDVDSSAFLSDTSEWVEIDRGGGIKYRLAQGNYFDQHIYTENRAYRYKLVDGEPVECTPEDIREQEEANKPVPPAPERSVWDELDEAYQEGVDSV